MNTKQYSFISIEDGYIVLDKEATPNCEWLIGDDGKIYHISKVAFTFAGYTGIIAHTGIPFLKGSGLPLMVLPDEIEAILVNYAIQGHDKESFLNGFKTGYKAAGGYTEEDMKKLLELYDYHKNLEDGFSHNEVVDEFLQSKKKPVAVVVEMGYSIQCNCASMGYLVDTNCAERNHCDLKPKVENGYIQVKEVIYG